MRIALSAGAVARASALIYLLPIAGLLAGAGLAQLAAASFLSAESAGRAAGLGGIAGVALAALLARRLVRRAGAGSSTRPRVTAVLGESSLTKDVANH